MTENAGALTKSFTEDVVPANWLHNTSLIFLHSFCPHLQQYSLTVFPLRCIQLHTAPCTTAT